MNRERVEESKTERATKGKGENQSKRQRETEKGWHNRSGPEGSVS